jgi:hypothetical protein
MTTPVLFALYCRLRSVLRSSAAALYMPLRALKAEMACMSGISKETYL